MVKIEDFEKIDIRVGKILEVDDFPEAKKPTYKLKIDFGKEIGIKKSSVQITENYDKKDLINKLVLCIINLPIKKIGSFDSEVLTLGVPDHKNKCILIKTDKEVPLGAKLY